MSVGKTRLAKSRTSREGDNFFFVWASVIDRIKAGHAQFSYLQELCPTLQQVEKANICDRRPTNVTIRVRARFEIKCEIVHAIGVYY